MSEPTIALDHARFRHAWTTIFTSRIVADCMSHRCTMVETGVEKLEACCQHGCDVDLFERDRIVAHAGEIRAVLRADANATRWFDDDEPELDSDAPSGTVIRTEVLGGGCIFLAHDRRGCAIHRAGLENGWDFRAVKPAVCQLFPLSYTTDAIVISDDYADYSCAHLADAPTLYRVGRDTLGFVFGDALVRALDAAEAQVLAAAPKRLPIV